MADIVGDHRAYQLKHDSPLTSDIESFDPPSP
jgi:hypothetical protein